MTQQEMRCFNNVLISNTDEYRKYKPPSDTGGGFSDKGFALKVCEFEYVSRVEPIKWLWTMPPQAEAYTKQYQDGWKSKWPSIPVSRFHPTPSSWLEQKLPTNEICTR